MLSRLALRSSSSSSSLLHCKSISKRWRCTTSSDSTTTTFPNQINEPSTDSVFVVANDEVHDYFTIDKKGIKSPYIPPWISKDKNIHIQRQVSNSCNGMILIPVQDSFFLFNPSTKYFAKVLELHDLSYFREDEYVSCLGFVYDDSINDYKALQLFSHDASGSCGQFVAQASLKGKKWSKVGFGCRYLQARQGPLFNGRIHWIACTKTRYVNNHYAQWDKYGLDVVCFNPVSSVFEILPSPPEAEEGKNLIAGLGVLEGCLWMTRRIWKAKIYEVLKMKEYGVTESWTTMFLFSNDELNMDYGSLTLLLITENRQILFLKSGDRNSRDEIFAYDPETKICTTLCKPERSLQAVPFVENLASPVGYDWDPIEHRNLNYFNDRDYIDDYYI